MKLFHWGGSRSSDLYLYLASYAAGCEAVALPAAAATARRSKQRAARAVPVAAAAARPDGAAVRRPRHRELVPLHRRLRLDYACNSNPNSYDSLTLFTWIVTELDGMME